MTQCAAARSNAPNRRLQKGRQGVQRIEISQIGGQKVRRKLAQRGKRCPNSHSAGLDGQPHAASGELPQRQGKGNDIDNQPYHPEDSIAEFVGLQIVEAAPERDEGF
ncbi:hypothetical protein PMm318_A27610 [Pseudomonas moorei]